MDLYMAEKGTSGHDSRATEESAAEFVLREAAEGKRVMSPWFEKLVRARLAIERSGMPLLTREEVERERMERRGSA